MKLRISENRINWIDWIDCKKGIVFNVDIMILICLTVTLMGCGQTGPLYHPDQPPPIKTVFPSCP